MADWDIQSPAKACAACQTPFPGGSTIVSGLALSAAVAERRDFCEPCFPGPEGLASFWHTRIPTPPPRKPRLDPGTVLEFFQNLEGDGPRERAYRYVLALYLVRKRLLRLEGIARGELKLVLARTGEALRVPEEPITPERIQETFEMLQQILAAPGAGGRPVKLEPLQPPAPA